MHLAALAKADNKKLFRLRPKLHMAYEIFMSMEAPAGAVTLNCLATCTWSDEDFIGRVSRVARSAHGATISISCLRKCLGLYAFQLKQAKKC